MATGNKQAGEWMSPDYGNIDATMKKVADLRGSKPHGEDDTSWFEDDIGPACCKPSQVRERYGRTGG